MPTEYRKKNSIPQRTQLVGNPNAGTLVESSLFPKTEAQAITTHPTMAVDAGFEHPPAGISPFTTVADAVERFYNRKARSGVSATTLSAIKAVLDRFLAQFGTRILASITSDEIERFVETPTKDRGGPRPLRTVTKLKKLKLVKALFRREGAIDPFPGLKIKAPQNSHVVRVFDANEVETMLRAARPDERGLVALAIYGGFRPLELERMSGEMVDLKARTIRVPGKLSLDGRTVILSELGSDGVLPCLPSIIFDWLKEHPFEPKRWLPIKSRLTDALGGRWIRNGCRQTAIANCAAVHGIMAALALMGQGAYPRRLAVRLYPHYKSLVSRREAQRVYSLTPSSVIPKP